MPAARPTPSPKWWPTCRKCSASPPTATLPAWPARTVPRVASLVSLSISPCNSTQCLRLALHTNNVPYDGVSNRPATVPCPTSLNVTTTDNITWIVTFTGNTDARRRRLQLPEGRRLRPQHRRRQGASARRSPASHGRQLRRRSTASSATRNAATPPAARRNRFRGHRQHRRQPRLPAAFNNPAPATKPSSTSTATASSTPATTSNSGPVQQGADVDRIKWIRGTVRRSPFLVLSPSMRQSGELFRKILDHFNAIGRPMSVVGEIRLRWNWRTDRGSSRCPATKGRHVLDLFGGSDLDAHRGGADGATSS